MTNVFKAFIAWCQFNQQRINTSVMQIEKHARPPNGDHPAASRRKPCILHSKACSRGKLGMGPRTSPGAGVAKDMDMDHKGLEQLQLLTGPNMSKIFYSPCLVATLRRAGDDAIAKVDTRPKWEAWGPFQHREPQ